MHLMLGILILCQCFIDQCIVFTGDVHAVLKLEVNIQILTGKSIRFLKGIAVPHHNIHLRIRAAFDQSLDSKFRISGTGGSARISDIIKSNSITDLDIGKV